MTVADFFSDVRRMMAEFRAKQPERDTLIGVAFWWGMENPGYDKDLLNRWPKGSQERVAFVAGKRLYRGLKAKQLTGDAPFLGPFEVMKGAGAYVVGRRVYKNHVHRVEYLRRPAGKTRRFNFVYSASVAATRLNYGHELKNSCIY